MFHTLQELECIMMVIMVIHLKHSEAEITFEIRLRDLVRAIDISMFMELS